MEKMPFYVNRNSNVFWGTSVVHESPIAAIDSKISANRRPSAAASRPKTAISTSGDWCVVAPVVGHGRNFHGDLPL